MLGQAASGVVWQARVAGGRGRPGRLVALRPRGETGSARWWGGETGRGRCGPAAPRRRQRRDRGPGPLPPSCHRAAPRFTLHRPAPASPRRAAPPRSLARVRVSWPRGNCRNCPCDSRLGTLVVTAAGQGGRVTARLGSFDFNYSGRVYGLYTHSFPGCGYDQARLAVLARADPVLVPRPPPLR